MTKGWKSPIAFDPPPTQASKISGKDPNASSLNDWFNSEKEDPVLIDVREQSELEIARFSKEFINIPISKVTSEYVEEIFAGLLDREIVVTCHAGIRSYNFCLLYTSPSPRD